MSRIRSIDPSQWTEEDFVACSPAARLLLLGLRNEADDRGVFEWRPVSLKMRLLPADSVDIVALLAELVEHRQIARFGDDGRSYGLCLVWGQKPRRPHYRYPAPPDHLEQRSEFPADVGNEVAPDDAIPADVGNEVAPDDAIPASRAEQSRGKGRAGQGSRAQGPHPVPENLPEEWRLEGERQREEACKPPADPADQWRRFRNRLRGEKATTDGWLGRWVNWYLDAKPAADSGTRAPVEPEVAAPRQPLEHRLGPAGDRLLRLADDRKYQGWIAKLDVDRVENGTVYLVAADRFVRQLADQEHYSALRAAFGVENIEIAVADPKPEPKAAVAEAPIGGNGAAQPPSPVRRGGGKRPKPAGQRNLLLPVAGGGKGAAAEKPVSSPAAETDTPAERRGAA